MKRTLANKPRLIEVPVQKNPRKSAAKPAATPSTIEISKRAIEVAVDTALGEVARQTGDGVDRQIMLEARNAGIGSGTGLLEPAGDAYSGQPQIVVTNKRPTVTITANPLAAPPTIVTMIPGYTRESIALASSIAAGFAKTCTDQQWSMVAIPVVGKGDRLKTCTTVTIALDALSRGKFSESPKEDERGKVSGILKDLTAVVELVATRAVCREGSVFAKPSHDIVLRSADAITETPAS